MNHVTRMNESCNTQMNKVVSQVQKFAIGHHYWSSHWFLSNSHHYPSLSHAQVVSQVRHFALKLLYPRNPPHHETQIPRFFVVQIQIEILV